VTEPKTAPSRSAALKRALAAAGAAGILGAGVVGVAWAQTPPATPPATPVRPAGTPVAPDQRQEQFLTALAGKLGVTVDKLKQALTETRQSLGMGDRGGLGVPGGPGRPGGPGGPGRGGFSLQSAAQALNISEDQLRQELSGKTLTDVARAHNVDPAAVANALKTAAATRIDQDVAAGRLTADQATQAKQQANSRIDRQMTQQAPAAGAGGAPGAGRGGPPPSGTPRAAATPRP
jgi:hypothetical protein